MYHQLVPMGTTCKFCGKKLSDWRASDECPGPLTPKDIGLDQARVWLLMAPKDTVHFPCGCTVTTEVQEGKNTLILEACEEARCYIKPFCLEESKRQGKEIIFGRKDLTQ